MSRYGPVVDEAQAIVVDVLGKSDRRTIPAQRRIVAREALRMLNEIANPWGDPGDIPTFGGWYDVLKPGYPAMPCYLASVCSGVVFQVWTFFGERPQRASQIHKRARTWKFRKRFE